MPAAEGAVAAAQAGLAAAEAHAATEMASLQKDVALERRLRAAAEEGADGSRQETSAAP